jgi:FkbM family methyltransferase
LVSVAVKRAFVGTRAGVILREARDRLQIFEALWRYPEDAMSISNNRLFHKLVTRMTRPNGAFVDVGAHIGSIVAEVQLYCPSVKIHAFEPVPEKASRLERQFPQANVVNCAISEFSGESAFFVDRTESAYSSLGENMVPREHSSQRILVKVRSLDSFNLPADVDAIKIDVEGAEEGVFRGARQLLKTARPIVYFESACGDIPHLGYNKTTMWHILNELGFTIHIPNRVAHDDTGLSLEMFLSSHSYPRLTDNYVAIPNERRTEFRAMARTVLGL